LANASNVRLVIVAERRPTLRCFPARRCGTLRGWPFTSKHLVAAALLCNLGSLARLVRGVLWHGLGSRAAETAQSDHGRQLGRSA
jgi:hypothetical protein